MNAPRFLLAALLLSLLSPPSRGDDLFPEWYKNSSKGPADNGDNVSDGGPKLEDIPIRSGQPAAGIDEVAIRDKVLSAAREPGSRYGIQPGDILIVSVWREADMHSEVQVSPDGFITLPLIGEVPLNGLSVEEARVEITRRLTQYIPKAVVTVAIKEIRGNQIFVIGKVNRPGAFPFINAIDVVQALSLAGGAARFAEVEDIKIIRRGDERQQAIAFNYNEVQRGEHLEQNILLKSGDIVIVP